jgi:hypothetical protein
MISMEDVQARLEAAEATVQEMFCAVTADLILFQAAVAALREEGILTEKMIDRIAIDAQYRLQQFDAPALSPLMMSDIATQLDGLAERLRQVKASAPFVNPTAVDNGEGRGAAGSR